MTPSSPARKMVLCSDKSPPPCGPAVCRHHGLKRPAVLVNPDNPVTESILRQLDATASTLKLPLQRFEVRAPGEFEAVFSAMTRQRVDGLVIPDDGMLIANVDRLVALAAGSRLAGSGFKEYAEKEARRLGAER